jgi:hypothetical protein
LVTQEELLGVVPLTERQLRTLRDEHKIPFIKFGHRSILYNVPKVLAALEKLEVKEVQ